MAGRYPQGEDVKHKITDDVNVNLNITLPKEDLEQLIDKVTESVVVIIAAATVAHIFRRLV